MRISASWLLPSRWVRRALMLALVSAGFWSGTRAHGQPTEDFYKNKTVTILIGYEPGGAYDSYGRLAAIYLSRYLPGHPAVIVQNMAGAGSFTAANHLYARAARDGTVLGMVGETLAMGQLFKLPGISFDMGHFNWIGRMASSVEMTMAWHTSPIKKIQDAFDTELLLGSTSAQATTTSHPRVLARVLGAKFKIVLGYPGTPGVFQAMERGEVFGVTATADALLIGRPAWVTDKQVNVLVQYSVQRHSAFADVPTMAELGRTAEERQLFTLFSTSAEIGRAIFAPPDVPTERVAVLRKAFQAMLHDPEFVAEIEKRRMEFAPISGEEVQKRIQADLSVSAELADKAAKLWEK